MNKAQFIQHLIIRTCPATDKVDAAVTHGERLWESLTERGYGDKKPAEPRDLKDDYYSLLKPEEAEWFDRFWEAFNYKRGKQRAALRWAQLSAKQQLSDAQYQAIVNAAKKEGNRDFNGAARKHAEGWLNDRRYSDAEPGKKGIKNAALAELSTLNNELLQLQNLYQGTGNQALLPQIEKLKAKISAAMQQSSETTR